MRQFVVGMSTESNASIVKITSQILKNLSSVAIFARAAKVRPFQFEDNMIWKDIDTFSSWLEENREDSRVFSTCGGFDPIHVGHVRCLRDTAEMKTSNDLFVVIANGDGFLKTKKGYVFMPEPERMEVLHSIKGVDHVVLWYDGTQNCIGAIEKIKPNVFTKGGDRSSRSRIPEADMCDQVGCEIVFGVGGTDKPQSSSWLIEKAQKSSE